MSNSERFQDRKQKYQEIPTDAKYRSMREAYAVELRRSKRSENTKKRRLGAQNSERLEDFIFSADWVGRELCELVPSLIDTNRSSEERFTHLCSLLDLGQSLDIVQGSLDSLRIIVSENKEVPAQIILRSSVISTLLEILAYSDKICIYSALWCLINIIAGAKSLAKSVVEQGGVSALIRAYRNYSDDVYIQENALWALANISADSEVYAEEISQTGFYNEILYHIEAASGTVLQKMIWLISEAFRQILKHSSSFVEHTSHIIGKLIMLNNSEVLYETLCLFYSFSLEESNRKFLNDQKILERLMNLLCDQSTTLRKHSLKVLANYASDSADELIEMCILDKLIVLMNSPCNSLVKEAIYVLASLSFNEETADLVAKHLCFKKILDSFRSLNNDIILESLCCTNVLMKHLSLEMLFAQHSAFLQALCEVINSNDSKILVISLKALQNLFLKSMEYQKSHACNIMFAVKRFEELGGINRLNKLMEHPSVTVYQLCNAIMTQYID